MFKNIFKSMIFASFIICCCSNYLHATEQQKTLHSMEDSFIRNFVQKIGSNKVSYDGKNLILYADPSMRMIIITSIGLLVYTTLGISFSRSQDNVSKFLSLVMYLIDIMCLIGLSKNLYYAVIDTPVITIKNDKIKTWDGDKIRWDMFSRLKHENIRTTRDGITISREIIVHLCDEYLNSLLNIRGDYLPISIDNLIAILEHYIEKSN